MQLLQSLFGIVFFIGIAYALSNNRRAVNWKLVGIGIGIQFVLAWVLLKAPGINEGFRGLSEGFTSVLSYSEVGASFLFGDLARNSNAQDGVNHQLGMIIAFQVLPVILFFATLSGGLYYLGILPAIVRVLAWGLSRTMGLSGPESLSAAGNIFLGQTEAPLLVKPYIDRMSYSELMCLMTGGMATIAGSVLGAYVSFLGGDNPEVRSEFAAHLLTASFMNAPAAIVMAKIMIPQVHKEEISTQLHISREDVGVNLIDALTRGATSGLQLALNVGAMLLTFIAIIAMLNAGMKALGEALALNAWIESSSNGAFQNLSLQYLLGLLSQPLAFAMGVAWEETLLVGSLLGQKVALNEFIAYSDLGRMQSEGLLSPHSVLISTYALCGFANFASIAIQVGGIGAMAPQQQSNLSRLGIQAMVAASLACMLTGTLAGILLSA